MIDTFRIPGSPGHAEMPMPGFSADRNLLFGILALQMEFISRDALIAAMHAWMLDKAKPLGRILRDQGQLAEADHALLEAMVRRHLEKHGHDPQQSLAALRFDGPLDQDLQQLADADLHASLSHVSTAYSGPADVTRDHVRPDPLPPQARFLILRLHAEGGLGKVFVARDEELKREVALKEIRERHADNPESRARFLREAEVTGSLEHPGIVPVYGLGTSPDGRPFYAMRFIKGDSLKEAIAAFHEAERKGRPDSERSLALRHLLGCFVAVCQAIAYAHSRGVLHRDLKPSNIMLGKYGETLVVDWGLAKVLGQADEEATEGAVISSSDSTLTQTGKALGTPVYMSPEQAAGKLDEVGPASDVYSLGATLYFLLTGQAPFLKSDVGAVLGKVQRGDFPPPRQVNARVPAALEAVCLKAMALAPQDRYPSPRDLAGEVEHWLADEPVQARRERWPARLARTVRKRPALATGVGALLVTGVIALGVSTLLVGQAQRDTARALNKLEAEQRQRILTHLAALRTAAPGAVPGILDDLRANRSQVLPELRALYAGEKARGLRMRLALALVEAEPQTVRDELARWLVQADDPAEGRLVRDALAPHAGELKEALWRQARDADAAPGVRFRALAALAAFDPDNPSWKGHGALAAEQLMQANPLHLGIWVEAFRPVRQALRPTLAEVFRGQKLKESRQAATTVLADYLADEPAQLAELLLDADDRQFALLLPRLRGKGEPVSAPLLCELRKQAGVPAGVVAGCVPPGGAVVVVAGLLGETRPEAEQARGARRQAAAALALLRRGNPEPTWPLWRHTPTPEARSWLVQRAAAVGVDPRQLIEQLGREADVSAKRALILALGEYTEKELPAAVRQPLVKRLLGWYRDHPDPGIHGAIDWLLRHGKEGPLARQLDWEQRPELEWMDRELRRRDPDGQRGWYVNGQGMSFTLIHGPVAFFMGSPEAEPGRGVNEPRHWQRVKQSYALATRLVTVRQWKEFLKERPKIPRDYATQFSPEEDCPINNVSWFLAAAYCNWLSEKEGIPRDQWCYPEDIAEGGKITAGCRDKTGYRLPTEAEWEFACRAGAVTSRHYGSCDELLGRYGFYGATTEKRTWPVGQKRPNDLGLFGVHGSLWAWCSDRDGIAFHFLRGGSFVDTPSSVRSAARSRFPPAIRGGYFGLRVCRTIEETRPPGKPR
jgi:serine/threonine protein kinase/formylglycine-generating enzyme required for sulfatase activity